MEDKLWMVDVCITIRAESAEEARAIVTDYLDIINEFEGAQIEAAPARVDE